jgi:heparanase 1
MHKTSLSVLFAILLISVFSPSISAKVVSATVFLDDSHIVNEVHQEYGSFNLDWWGPSYDGWGRAGLLNIDLASPKLIYLAMQLTPAYLRIGGTLADTIVYEVGQHSACTLGVNCLNMTRWQQVLNFTWETGLTLVFDLSERYGKGKPGTWDPSNAKNFISYTNTLPFSSAILGYELGNELNIAGYSPTACAQDFITLRNIFNQFWPEKTAQPLLIGPDVTTSPSWLAQFLQKAGSIIDIVTYHMYLGYGLDPQLPQKILQPSFLNQSRLLAEPIVAAKKRYAPNATLWCGETAAAWHSGQNNTTNRFISGFWFLDQLGALAQMDHKVQCRQTLVGGYYELIEKWTLEPNPDYWTLLLFKKIMGKKVLNIYSSQPLLRVYAHCSRMDNQGVAMIFINLSPNETYEITLKGFPGESDREEYHLTSTDLHSQHMYLNGQLLQLQEGKLPPLVPNKVASTVPLRIAPLSYGFVVFPGAQVTLCNFCN